VFNRTWKSNRERAARAPFCQQMSEMENKHLSSPRGNRTKRKHKIEPPPPLSDGNSDVIQATAKPNKYDAALARRILDRIAEGELLTDICKDDDMPTRRSFVHWLETRRVAPDVYARARQSWAEHYAERIIKLAMDPRGNYLDANGNRAILSHEEVAQRRLEIDTFKWLVSKLAPKLYGDKPEPAAEPEDKIVKITRTIIDSPNRDAAVPVAREPGEPLMLMHIPKLPAPDGPLPATVQGRLRGILERCVPSDRHANAYALWDEVAGVIEAALTAHYGTER
jgi:hypothetical protein